MSIEKTNITGLQEINAAISDAIASDRKEGFIPPEPGQAYPPLPEPVPRRSLVDTGRVGLSKSITIPKSVSGFNTSDPWENYFHLVLYSDTNMHKTVEAARFDDPANTLIISTRADEQVRIPLRDDHYEIMRAPDGDALQYGLQHPFHWWETRKAINPNLGELKTVILDDGTEGVNFLVDEGGSADKRKNYRDAETDLKTSLKLLRANPINIIVVALAKIKENRVTNKDRVGPDLPPSMMGMIGAEFEYCFYIMPETYNFLTDRDWTSFTEEVEGKTKSYRVETFAKNKLPRSLVGQQPPVLAKIEKRSLREIWQAIQSENKQKIEKAGGITPTSRFARRGK